MGLLPPRGRNDFVTPSPEVQVPSWGSLILSFPLGSAPARVFPMTYLPLTTGAIRVVGPGFTERWGRRPDIRIYHSGGGQLLQDVELSTWVPSQWNLSNSALGANTTGSPGVSSPGLIELMGSPSGRSSSLSVVPPRTVSMHLKLLCNPQSHLQILGFCSFLYPRSVRTRHRRLWCWQIHHFSLRPNRSGIATVY